MKTIKVIDLLVNIANGKEVPEEIVYGGITYYFNKENRTYEEDMYESGAIHSLGEVINIDDELNNEVEIVEDTPKVQVEMTQEEFFKYLDSKLDTPKEDKNIDYLDLDDLNKLIDASYNDYMLRRIIHKAFLETKGKINEIIERLNGE